MTSEHPGGAGRPEDWAQQIATGLESRADADWALHVAVHGAHNLAAENKERRARAVHAAAMGLDHAGCAAAAGVSESLLSTWRAQHPVFDAALATATAMAAVDEVTAPGRLSGMSLGLFLQAVARGTAVATAARAVGLTSSQLRRLRERHTDVDHLTRAAIRHSLSPGTPKRARRPLTYRLIRSSEPSPPPR
ncbi:hypothetical protein [Streptomyces sp. NRRL S-241]|uniref:hypothetical protein n=1 Tax=Streptomyces sp. NRRL S-241 TaxID=1463896 RepID=UPI0004C1CD71|nr:hypothetical protein [Streptomyces sp. NRRL S-241]